MITLLICTVAFAVGMLYLVLIRRYDRYEPEPLLKMLIAMLLGGVCSVSISLVLYEFFPVQGTVFHAIAYIGPIEEFSKLAALWIVYLVISKEFNEPVDGVIYVSCVALGFATIENVMYSMSSEKPFALLLIRSVLCVVGHMAFSCYLGFAFYIQVQTKKNISGIIVALVLASLGHGIYDGILFGTGITNIAIGFVVLLVIVQLGIVKYCLSISNFKLDYHEQLFEQTTITHTAYCSHCEDDRQATVRHFQNIIISECESCESHIIPAKDFKKLLRWFRPMISWRRFKQFNRIDERNVHFLDETKSIIYNSPSGWHTFKKEHFQVWLDGGNNRDIDRLAKKNIAGWILRIIGFEWSKELPHLKHNRHSENL